MTRVLVTGGTGVLGRELVGRLAAAGHTVRLMSRRSRPAATRPDIDWAAADLETGQGLAGAVAGVQVIIHAASDAAHHTQQIDVEGTRRLLEQARSAGVAHFVYVSIVGVDRIPLDYYRHKLAAEAIVASGAVPWSILRATQFHNLLDGRLQAATRTPLPFALLPADLQFQPVDEGEVAGRLAEVAARPPSGRLPDMGGPEVHRMGDLARTWFEVRGRRRTILHLPLPGAVWDGYRRGYNTCPENRQGKITWAEWVRRRYSSERAR